MLTEELIEKIDLLSSRNGISRSKALIDSGVGKDFISDIKRKNTTPSIKKLQMLADYFNVSTDYLLGNEQKESPSTQLSEKEQELLDLFKLLNADEQAAYLALMKAGKK